MEALTFNTAMLVSGIVLAVTFILIFTEQLHGYERSKVAAAGAVAMIIVGQIFGFYTPMEAVDAVDWNVIFLLAAMMTIVSIMIPTGGFAWMAYKIAAMSRGRLYLMLVMLGTAVTVLSLLLDNVTTVVIFGPLIILIARAQKISPIPYLLAAALLSNTGGIATLVGDPPNIMIGSAADISFNTFVYHMGLITLVSWVAVLVALKFLFKKELAQTPADTTLGSGGNQGPQAVEGLYRDPLHHDRVLHAAQRPSLGALVRRRTGDDRVGLRIPQAGHGRCHGARGNHPADVLPRPVHGHRRRGA